MTKEEQQLNEYEDTLIMLNSMFEQYGVRETMKDFRAAFPRMFEELAVQVNRLVPEKQVAALLRASE